MSDLWRPTEIITAAFRFCRNEKERGMEERNLQGVG